LLLLKKLRYKNFLSSGNAWIEFDLTAHKNVLIVGKNGTGKSTFIDALTFGLFGRPFRNINIPQLVNSILKRDMMVEVEFSHNNVEYLIRRGLNPKSATPKTLEILKNGELLSQDASKIDQQKFIEDHILHTNLKTFKSVVILGAASYTPFMQLAAADRRQIVEDLLDQQVFTVMNSLLDDMKKETEKEIFHIESEKNSIEGKIELTKSHMENLRQINETLIAEKQKDIQDHRKEIEATQAQIDNFNNTISTLQEQIADKLSVEEKDEKLKQFRVKLNSKIKDLNKDIKFFEKNQTCPTCEQDIDPHFKAEMIKDRNETIGKNMDGLQTLEAELQKINGRLAEIKEISEAIQENKMQISVHKAKIRHLTESIEDTQEEIKSTEKTINNEEDMQAKIAKLLSLKGEIEQKFGETMDQKEVMKLAAILLKDNGIKAKIVKQYIPVINQLINKYLAALDFFCEFYLDETFNETIKSRGRDIFSYNSFSEGQKLRIDLAVLMAWRALAKMRNSMHCNLLVYDEILDRSLDGEGVDEFIKILQTLTKNQNVFIISHKEQFLDKFDKVIRFDMVKNFSQMIEVN